MRWRSREEPYGSHQVEARPSKCEISVGSTEVLLLLLLLLLLL